MNPRHQTGLECELKAASHYVSKGYEIFWPMSTQSRADFVIYRDNKFLKVQVKKATWSKTGNYRYLQSRVSTRNKNCRPLYKKGDFDIVIFLEEGGRMWEMPFEVIEGMTSVCLASTNIFPKKNGKTYDPADWEINQ